MGTTTMRIKTFFYAIGQSFKNMWRNRGYALASIATITACLFLFGLVLSVVINFYSMMHAAQQDVSVTVFFKEGVTEEEILQLKVAVEERTEEVSEVTYISADEAWASFSEEYLGEYADGFTENPLADSANLEINLQNVSKQDDLVAYLEGIDIVREVNRSDLTAETLSGANVLVGYASAAIIGILFVVSIFLISNTIATGINMHRDEINIMKYIGATDFYVRAPYVFEGILIGLIGALIPLVLIYYIYNRGMEFIQNRFSILTQLFTLMPIQEIFHYLLPISIVLGVGIGIIGSTFTIRKHLHV